MSLSFSIVIETENLGMAGINDLKACLDSLKKQSIPIKKVKEVLIIVGGHVSEKVQKELRLEYPWLVIKNEKQPLDYLSAKELGARAATGEVVVFADSDLRYGKYWLENLLSVFTDGSDADLSSGDTRAEIDSAYAMSLNLCWMFFIRSPIKKLIKTFDFSFNNFAIKREIVLNHRLPINLPLYRGKGSVWKAELRTEGVKMYRAPGTRAYHALPSTFIDWWYRMLINGHDYVALGDFVLKNGKMIEKRSFLRRFRNMVLWVGWKGCQIFMNTWIILKEDLRSIRFLPLGLPLAFINLLVLALGSLITLINRDYLFNKISSYEAGNSV